MAYPRASAKPSGTVSKLPGTVRAKALLLVAGLVSAISISACGGSSGNGIASKSPQDILSASTAAADSATSVHVSGHQTSGSASITLDLSLLAGKGGRGLISNNGLSFELIVIGNVTYIKGSPSFYRRFGGSAAAQLFQGKWLKSSNSGELAVFSSLTDMRKLIDTELVAHGKVQKGSTTTIAGQKVIPLTDTSKGGILYVAATGKPYPIEITKHGSEGGTITFDHWNEPVSIKPPIGAIDLSQLEAAGKH
jgi:hypothetical protein